MRIIVRGQDARCQSRTGTVTLDHGDATPAEHIAAWVARRYELGWRWLTVTDDADPSHIIGRIEITDGRRTWWAES